VRIPGVRPGEEHPAGVHPDEVDEPVKRERECAVELRLAVQDLADGVQGRQLLELSPVIGRTPRPPVIGRIPGPPVIGRGLHLPVIGRISRPPQLPTIVVAHRSHRLRVRLPAEKVLT
jgi:hypothetical protein